LSIKQIKQIKQTFDFPDDEGEEGVGEFQEMVEAQRRTGGFLLEKSPLESSPPEEEVHVLLDAVANNEQELIFLTVNMKHQYLAALRPLMLGNWMFDVVADWTSITKPRSCFRRGVIEGYKEN
jgi:ATP-binding cassette, subfamily B (MDR/TAP), member 1